MLDFYALPAAGTARLPPRGEALPAPTLTGPSCVSQILYGLEGRDIDRPGCGAYSCTIYAKKRGKTWLG